MEKVTELLSVLPKTYDIDKVRKTFQINITPTGVVLIQELERFNRLITAMERHLIDLQNVINANSPRERRNSRNSVTIKMCVLFADGAWQTRADLGPGAGS